MTSLRQVRTRKRHTPSAPKVGLFGLLGQGNLGNDGSLEAILAYLTAEHPGAILDLMCGGPDQMTARYGIPAVRLHWYNPARQRSPGTVAFARKGLEAAIGSFVDGLRIAWWVRRHDVVIVPGMGVLEANLPLRAWHTPYSMFLLCASGRLFGSKVALVSVGADVIDQRVMRWLIVTAARLAHYRSYRDDLSRNAMRRMGVNTSCDSVYPDLAFSLPTPHGDRAIPGAVGVGVMDFSGGNHDRHRADEIRACYVEKMKRFVLWLADNGRQVRLFTSDVHDEPVMQEIIRDMRERRPELDPSQIVAEPVSSIQELMRRMAVVETVVASRYHNVICALKLGKPTVSVGYAAKFGELMANAGLAEFCQAASSLDVDQLITQFTAVESRSAELCQRLKKHSADNMRLLDHQFATLSATLFPPTGSVATVAQREHAP